MIELIVIFIAKVIEVSLTTMRTVFISKGEKLYASAIGLAEVLIWLKLASVVLDEVSDNPAKMLVYALGFSAGSYVGLLIEERIGLGYSNVQIIVLPELSAILAQRIRNLGFAVTTINGEGRDKDRVILSVYMKRKQQEKVINCIEELGIKAVVTVTDTQKIQGAFGIK